MARRQGRGRTKAKAKRRAPSLARVRAYYQGQLAQLAATLERSRASYRGKINHLTEQLAHRPEGAGVGVVVLYEAPDKSERLQAFAELGLKEVTVPRLVAAVEARNGRRITAQEQLTAPLALENESVGTGFRRLVRDWLDRVGASKDQSPAVAVRRLTIEQGPA